MKKKIQKIALIGITILLAFLIIIPLTITAFFSIPWISVGLGTWLFTPNPPKPTVKYGEFPFNVTYEIDGETFTINDIYVCEYDGIGMDEGVGKYVKWKGYIKSTGKENILLKKENDIEFFLNVGSPEYYMNYGQDENFTPFIETITTEKLTSGNLGYSLNTISFDLAAYHHNINIINIDISEPINKSNTQ